MLILDRFEENLAVIEKTDENGEITYLNIDRSIISSEVREGEVLYLREGIYYTDAFATERRRKEILERLKAVTRNRKHKH